MVELWTAPLFSLRVVFCSHSCMRNTLQSVLKQYLFSCWWLRAYCLRLFIQDAPASLVVKKGFPGSKTNRRYQAGAPCRCAYWGRKMLGMACQRSLFLLPFCAIAIWGFQPGVGFRSACRLYITNALLKDFLLDTIVSMLQVYTDYVPAIFSPLIFPPCH